MRFSINILSRFVNIKSMDLNQLADRLTMSGLEVSGIEDHSCLLDRVVIGQIRKVWPHPNAEKLSLTEVEIPGSILRIVCGAKNIAPEDKVPVALEGAILPGNLKIARAKIRGQESEGMLCSERELGLSEEHAGIMHLPAAAPLGQPVAEFLGLRDAILDVEITPNRADCLSHLGLARQISAVMQLPLVLPAAEANESSAEAAAAVSLSLEPEAGCRRYCARVIRGVRVGPSPAWLQQALRKLGFRTVNNLVDISNYVMLEIGHPLHAFDLRRLSGTCIYTRRSVPGETITVIDGTEHKLTGKELVIADSRGPVALAGVMGGKATEVTDNTTDILLEAAWFDRLAVRRTVRATGCISEASYRFERGTDPEFGLLLSLNRAAILISEIAGGSILKGIVSQFPGPKPALTVNLNLEKAAKILGLAMSAADASASLQRLGFMVQPQPQNKSLAVTVPSFRQDVSVEEDLIEEIAQVGGYDRIPVSLPKVHLAAVLDSPRRRFAAKCRKVAAELGLNEVLSYSFGNPQYFDHLRLPSGHAWRQALALRNPLNVETSLLRTSLLPGLLETALYNQRRGQDRLYLFELGAVFLPDPQHELPREPLHLGLLMCGPRFPRHWRWGKKPAQTDFFDLKGCLEGFFRHLRLFPADASLPSGVIHLQSGKFDFLHPEISFRLLAGNGADVGWAGALHPESQEKFKFKETVFSAEVCVDSLFAAAAPERGLKPFSRFPSSIRDIALAVSEDTPAGDIVKEAYAVGGPLLTSVEPFDLYRGDELKTGMKSLAFSLTFQAQDRTLQEEELRSLQAKIVAHLQNIFSAQQR